MKDQEIELIIKDIARLLGVLKNPVNKSKREEAE